MTPGETVRREHVRFAGHQGVTLAADRWAPSGAERRTVLLLPGGGQTRRSWSRTAERLAAEGWPALGMDARGHGDSEWSPAGAYRLDDFVADLHAVVDQLGAPPVVVGASLGGRTALAAEGESPGLLAGLVLVDITHRVDRTGQARVRRFLESAPNGFGSLDEAAAAVDAYRPRPGTRRNLDGLRKNLRRRADGRWYWHWDPGFLAFAADARNSDETRLTRAARHVTIPTLLVRGRHSDMVPRAAAAELLELIPSAELVEVAAGHMIAGDDNDVFTERLCEFLAGRVP
ncbi:alpha/beta fold hydrolase [Amycolatopsis viridis]|uniref:Pimeloyl-ACP methyl ester carboxylesterase n=1 Tax=Amycolatopsis viridis TaxID=185678 RepID=A0ABX0SW50_9PSEU|nr:alpha/beta hydrolase [Amycolatopsis viridis]NIH80758.1 pimeloyl-ACP methyl ester carboxylesterase [Amycolatopsis viridis]